MWDYFKEEIINAIGLNSFTDEEDYWFDLYDNGYGPEEALMVSNVMIAYDED